MAAPTTIRLGAITLALLALLATACSGTASKPTVKGTVVHVTERDFHISVNPVVVPEGNVSLVTRNLGPDTHELIVVKASDGALPLRPDGITLDEEALKPRTVGELPGGAPGSLRVLRLHLPPGRYVLFCNMLGHYLGGMHAEITVR
jgi:uncharacterized cupredoxin-like copper-binding protein